jgi:hypothetical protein
VDKFKDAQLRQRAYQSSFGDNRFYGHALSNLKVTATTEGKKLFLLITYKCYDCLLEVEKLYPFIIDDEENADI